LSFGETVGAGLVVAAAVAVAGWFLGVPGRIARWRESQRVFAPPTVTPQFLLGLREGKTELEGDRVIKPHLGYWMRISGNVQDVNAAHMVSVRVAPNAFVGLSFRRKWHRHVMPMPVGTPIKAIGRIERVASVTVFLADCEMDEGKG